MDNVKSIASIISDFEKSGDIPIPTIERLLTSGDLYDEFIDYVNSNTHKTFSRALLESATTLRRNEESHIMIDDLVFFSWFVSKNREVEDLRLVVSAKVVDFDGWCGFDGAMVYMVLDYDQTQDYLRNNGHQHPEVKTMDHLLRFSREEVEKYRENWRPPFR